MKKSIYSVAFLFIGLFGMVAIYLGYFTLFERDRIAMHPYNRRLDHLESEVIRGTIYDAQGEVLAQTKEGKRDYPFGSRYAHAVGYAQNGKIGAEALANTELLYPDYNITSIFRNAFMDEKFEGRDIVLTLDNRLQAAAAEALGDYRGAVVVLDPTTGKILTMYSSPTFNPNHLVENWEDLREDEARSPLVNRATHGLYPPGSIFKIFPTLSVIQNPEAEEFVYECKGFIEKEGHKIQCYDGKAHGRVDLTKAFVKSCNAYFIALSNQVDFEQLAKTSEMLLFNAELPIDLEYAKSKFPVEGVSSFEQLAAYIGQGKVLVTPMHMAMVASIIANDGVLMKPYLFDYATNESKEVLSKRLPEYVGVYIDEKSCARLQELMRGVVEEGTAMRLSGIDLDIGGKTGTAQNATGKDHSWFMGFAKKSASVNNDLAFAIIVENGGQGAKALSVAKTVLKAYSNIAE
ncbi:MAG: peptidoglycan D,D-transpeptidase FtsI family protein [Cellulosilyticaceae bacterium]